MSFFERAKAAASDLAAKADVAMSNAGVNVPGMGGDRALRDLGVLAWLEATGRPVDAADRERVMTTLRELETAGRLGPLTVTPTQPYGAPPPPPGAGAPPPPPGAGAPPPPPPAPGAGAPPPPPPGGVSPAGDAPAGPPPGAAPDPRPPLPDTDEQPPSSSTPPPPPPPSWA